MTRGFFITGTDTGVGKTLVSCLLLEFFNAQGLHTAAMKPVASGCRNSSLGWRNDDAEQLQQAASIDLSYEQVNPYALPAAIAPHLAAHQCNMAISIEAILENFRHIYDTSQLVIVEGVGGWFVPLNETQTTADLARRLKLPVIVVVGIRLGCINHALLTIKAIQQDRENPPIAGWVANIIDPETAATDEVIESLQAYIKAPLLGTIPHLKNTKARGDWLHLGLIDVI